MRAIVPADKIAGAEVTDAGADSGHGRLLVREPRQVEAELAIHLLHEPGAVDTGVVVPAEHVPRTEVGAGKVHDPLSAGPYGASVLEVRVPCSGGDIPSASVPCG